MTRKFLYSFLLLTVLMTSCKKKTEDVVDDWEKFDIKTETPILNTHANNRELILATATELYRINRDQEFIEKRPLEVYSRIYGRPMISDFVFTRVTKNLQNRQIIEFHLTKTPNAEIPIVIEDLIEEDENVIVDSHSRNTGVFNADGTKFMLPVAIFPNYSYSMLIFDIELNATKDEFVAVELEHRIDIPELPYDLDNITNMRFLDGNYYLGTVQGAFRITPEGEVTKLFPQWIFDFFEVDDKLYMTGYNSWSFYSSSDSGLTWDRVEGLTELEMVEVINGEVFTQSHLFDPLKMSNDDLLTVEEIDYAREIPLDFSTNFVLNYFDGKYYLAISKEMYEITEIQLD